MATSVFRRYEMRERSREDDCGSEASTLRANNVFRPDSSDSARTYIGTRYDKSVARVGSHSQIYKSEQFNSDSDEATFDDEDEYSQIEEVKKHPSVTRVSRIDSSPEAEQKRKEAYNKWLNCVIAREKDLKRLAVGRAAAEREEERQLTRKLKAESEEKVNEWMRKKRIEADKEMARQVELQKKLAIANEKPKEFKKAIDFQEWLKMKNEKLVVEKKQTAEKKKPKDTLKRRESVTHEQWMRTSSSKAKPVPFNRGLDSLKGSTTKLFVNPEPWRFDE